MAKAKRWFAYLERKLRGPATAEEIVKIKGFGPDTEVTEADREEFWLPAKQIKELKPFFQNTAAKPSGKPVPSARKKILTCPSCGAHIDVEEGRMRVKCSHCLSPLTLSKTRKEGAGVLASVVCPSCGGLVEYPEDSRTAHCAWCDSYLLIVSPGRAYRHYVPPRVTREAAEASAKKKHKVKSAASLVFIPYWRYKATIFYWVIGQKTVETQRFGVTDADLQSGEAGFDFAPGSFTAKERVREFRSRRLDRSMRAGKESIGYSGLGDRLSRMPMRPFSRKEMEKLGRVGSAVLSRDEALEWLGERACRGMGDAELTEELERGSVLGGRLSLVYLPFWVFEGGRGGALVLDGIDGLPVRSAPVLKELQARHAVDDSGRAPHAVMAQCGRCGQDLRIENFQAVFFCPDCQLAWRLDGGKLVRQPFRVMREVKSAGKRVLHVPVWRMRVTVKDGTGTFSDLKSFRRMVPDVSFSVRDADAGRPFWVYAAAWGNLVVPRLSRVGRLLTRKQPKIESSDDDFADVVRAVYGPEEARQLVPVVLLGVIYLQRKLLSIFKTGKIEAEEPELLLLPAAKSPGSEFVESCMGTAVRANELKETRS